MVREKEAFLIRLMKLSDAAVIGLSFVGAFYFTLALKKYLGLRALSFAPSTDLRGLAFFLKNHILLVVVTIPAWISLMSVDSVYANFRTKPLIEILWRILRTGSIALLVLGSAVFLMKMELTSRMYILVFFTTAFWCIAIEKALWKKFLDYSFRQGYNLVNLLIVGTGNRAQEFIKIVNEHANWGLHIAGLIDDDPKLLGRKVLEYEVLGRIRDIPRIVRNTVVDRIIFVVPRAWLNRIEEAIDFCEREGIQAAVSVDLYKPKLAMLHQSNFAGIPLIVFLTGAANEWQLLFKRIVDITLSLFLLVFLLPLLLFTIAGIKLTSRGPVLFRQVRCGRYGRKFTVYKFRSMVVGAEMRKKALLQKNEMDGPVFKMKRDPSVTPFGRFMRKFSIDELPQLINVIKGDMSLVGPRPPLPAEVELYESWKRRRLSMKPGITCIWQVSGRNKVDFSKWMEMDLQYIDQFSLWLDFRILVRTFFVVLTGYGAA